MSSTNTPQLESLEGIVERITFHSDESGYTVARFKVPRTPDLVTIIGNFAQIEAGQTLKLSGLWRDHPKFGQQFQVAQYRETKPATLTGMEKYLGSGLIKGVGPVTAKRIVAHFGLDTLDIIENQIERLLEVPGIAHKRVKMIQSAWEKQKAIKEVMVFLQGHGVSTTYAVKIFKQYGDAAIAKVTENPYQLAADIYGIGFVTADTLARNLGIEPGSEFRYRAGIVHVLGEAAEDGHCFLPFEELVEQTVTRLAIDDHQPQKNAIARLIQQMGQLNELVLESSSDQPLCYKPSFFQTEQNLAQRLRQRLISPVTVDLPRVRRWLLCFREKTGIQLSEQQQQAVEIAAIFLELYCTQLRTAIVKRKGQTISSVIAKTGFSPLAGIRFVESQENPRWRTHRFKVSVPLRGLGSWKDTKCPDGMRRSSSNKFQSPCGD